MFRVDIKLGFACNNHCDFCVQGDKRKRYGARPLDQIVKDLHAAKHRGAQDVVLTGGEPTVHKTLLETIRTAKALGYRTIQIQSNGRRFSHPELLDALINAGANEFSPALHGAKAATHDALTHAEGSYEQTVAGIRAIRERGFPVVTNSVITQSNFRELPELATLFVELGVKQFQFAFVHILGTADRNREWIVPRKSEAIEYIHKALDIGREAGTPCFTEAIPYCFMEGYEECVAESMIPHTFIYDADKTIENYTDFRWQEGKIRGPMCDDCSFGGECEGPWREYVDLYGWDEFKIRV